MEGKARGTIEKNWKKKKKGRKLKEADPRR